MKTHYKGERKFPFPVTLAFLPTYTNMDNADSPSFTEFRERDKAVGLSGGTVSLLSKLNLILIFKEWSYWEGGCGIFIVHVNFLPLKLHGRQSSRLFIRSTKTDKIAPPSIPTGCPPLPLVSSPTCMTSVEKEDSWPLGHWPDSVNSTSHLECVTMDLNPWMLKSLWNTTLFPGIEASPSFMMEVMGNADLQKLIRIIHLKAYC